MVIDANGLDANAKNDHESVSTSFVDVASASILQHLNTEDDTMDDTASKVVTASLEYETDVADSDSEVAFSQHQIDSAVDSLDPKLVATIQDCAELSAIQVNCSTLRRPR